MYFSCHLDVNGLAVSGHAGLLDGLGKCRVSMRRPANVLRAGLVLDGETQLTDELASVVLDNVRAEDAVRLSASKHLYKPVGLAHSLGARVGGKGKLALVVLDAAL